ncbi:kinase-like domain-containing protein [Stachybotrys elegans]|uniref:Kinase-like domain-containing protein n=1 Tax=Stachybotrys elegans TaxID=80388 RepID=A0A8K0WUC0_9HYPO|nr:kinase-like domain-containing protein [Stachybotrys elegans]
MPDNDLIARIFPHDSFGKASRIIELGENQAFAILESSSSNSHLALRFSQGPKTEHGFVFGKCGNSDITLGGEAPEADDYHLALTFDGHNRLVIKDFGTQNGTQVTYSGKGDKFRSDFTWIIGGHDFLNGNKTIVVSLGPKLEFRIEVNPQDATSAQYLDNVKQFHQGSKTTEARLLNRNIQKRRPISNNGAITPLDDPSNLKNHSEYYVKYWRKEASILQRLSHEHIVRLIKYTLDPKPQLFFEFVPNGTLLRPLEPFTSREYRQILCQCLSALEYLHGHEPPIVHRDVKSDNILVQSRGGGDIFVKLGDFGLSRDEADPTTACGNGRFKPPEMYIGLDSSNHADVYTSAVDIWSLGVTIFHCMGGLPHRGRDYYTANWPSEVVKTLRDHIAIDGSDAVCKFLQDKVILKPELRGSAKQCYERLRWDSGPWPQLQSQSQSQQRPAHDNAANPTSIMTMRLASDATAVTESGITTATESNATVFTGNGIATAMESDATVVPMSGVTTTTETSTSVIPPGAWYSLTHPLGVGSSVADFIAEQQK